MLDSKNFRFGFRTLGRDAERRQTEWRSAFAAHVAADPKAATPGECFLSHFQFGDEFREHVAATNSTAGYTGPTWAEWVAFDIDVAGDIDEALRHNDGQMAATARALDLERSHLYKKCKALGLRE